MAVTRHEVAEKIGDYLQHRITQERLVNWAENAQLEGGYEESYFDAINEALTKIGVANVENYELTWEDYEHLLQQLGYSVKVQLVSAA